MYKIHSITIIKIYLQIKNSSYLCSLVSVSLD